MVRLLFIHLISLCLNATNTHHEHKMIEGDAHEVADYLNFGGRLGTGQRCKTGLDCATGACSSPTKQCNCQLGCDSSESCISGCASEETCIPMEETGMNACWSNVTGVIVDPANAAVDIVQSQSLTFLMALSVVMMRIRFP